MKDWKTYRSSKLKGFELLNLLNLRQAKCCGSQSVEVEAKKSTECMFAEGYNI